MAGTRLASSSLLRVLLLLWLTVCLHASRPQKPTVFEYTPKLKYYKRKAYVPPVGALMVTGDGLSTAVTGQENSFIIQLADRTVLSNPNFLGLYVTLDGESTVMGMFATPTAGSSQFNFSYKPIIPGKYEVNVDIVNRDPFIPVAPMRGGSLTVKGEDLFGAQARAVRCERNMAWKGDWIKCNSPSHKQLLAEIESKYGPSNSSNSSNAHCLRWGKMVFVPRTCHYDIFSLQELRLLSQLPTELTTPPAPPMEERSKNPSVLSSTLAKLSNAITIVGTSVNRGIYQGMVDHVMGEWDKGVGTINKCWGYMSFQYYNLSMTYQDFRGVLFTSYPSFAKKGVNQIECHDNHIAMDYLHLEINSTEFMHRLFASNPTTLVFQFNAVGDRDTLGKSIANLIRVPAWWKGTLIGIFVRDALNQNLLHPQLEEGLQESWSKHFGRPIVLVDSVDMVLPMLQHQEYGVNGYSQHWGVTRPQRSGDMHVFGIVQDMIAQIILNAHFGSKPAVLRTAAALSLTPPPPAVKKTSPRSWNFPFWPSSGSESPPSEIDGFTLCYDCPLSLTPFHTNFDPALHCAHHYPVNRQYEKERHAYNVPCPQYCLEQPISERRPIQHGFVSVRVCTLEDRNSTHGSTRV